MAHTKKSSPPEQHGSFNIVGNGNKQRIRIDSLHLHAPSELPQPKPPVKSRLWVELCRLQHTTVLAACLAMLASAILCCLPGAPAIPVVTPLVAILSLVGTVGFGYFFYTERAFD